MLVTPKPEEHSVQIRCDLLSDTRVAGLERAEPLMVTEQNHWAPVASVREDDLLQPAAVRRMQTDPVTEQELEERKRAGVKPSIDCNDAPVAVLEAEVARRLR